MDKSLYQRPNKPNTMMVTRRARVQASAPVSLPKVIEVSKDSQCHITPLGVGQRMAQYLELEKGMHVLEPQGGTGNLVQAVLDQHIELNRMTTVEHNYTLHQTLKDRFSSDSVNIHHGCFLEFANKSKTGFERIITNPPFKAVKKHMSACLSLLNKGNFKNAICVALVPITYDHEKAAELERLPADTFTGITVNTKIIKFAIN